MKSNYEERPPYISFFDPNVEYYTRAPNAEEWQGYEKKVQKAIDQLTEELKSVPTSQYMSEISESSGDHIQRFYEQLEFENVDNHELEFYNEIQLKLRMRT